jgi:hypothetical protein
MQLNRHFQAINNATITANGGSGALDNIGQSNNPTIVSYLNVTGWVSGTLNVAIYGSSDGVNFTQLAAFAAVSANLAAPQRLVVHDVLEPFVQVMWAVSGASPNIGGVTCDLYMTSPDS